LVEQRSSRHGDGCGDGAGLESGVDGGGAVALDENLGIDLSFEAVLGKSNLIVADRKVNKAEGAVAAGRPRYL
jgi:hypothetical protein